MSEIKIGNAEKYYLLSIKKFSPYIDGEIRPYLGFWLENEECEGMEIRATNINFFNAIDKFFKENF